MPLKVIVTNRVAMAAKYGKDLAKIDGAIAKLVAADGKRGLQTTTADLSSASEMKAAGGKKVSAAKNARACKEAIDAVCTRHQPDYLMILGAPDLIPHQSLRNPMQDDDDEVMSDLPYACEAPYSRDAEDFTAPTRVVSRLPDVAGSSNALYLVGLLDVAASWQSRPRKAFESYFGISAAVWEKSTRLSLKNLLGNGSRVKLSPTEGPNWTASFLGRRTHFINCHGDRSDIHFYGDDDVDYPIAHISTYLSQRIKEGTVAAAECCYGAELWDVAHAPAANAFGICSTYLEQKAYGFFGSTNIAYGPADKNESADLICRHFLESVLAGASLGRAALEARQRYVKQARRLDPTDLKALAQFLLLGDPSIHPVKTATKSVAATASKAAKPLSLSVQAKSLGLTGTSARRTALVVQGLRWAAETPAATVAISSPVMEARAAELAREAGLRDVKITAHAFESTPVVEPRGLAFALTARATPSTAKARKAPSHVYVVVGHRDEPRKAGSKIKRADRPGPKTRRAEAMVMEEVGEGLRVVKLLHSKA
jgi:hypothetical protein